MFDYKKLGELISEQCHRESGRSFSFTLAYRESEIIFLAPRIKGAEKQPARRTLPAGCIPSCCSVNFFNRRGLKCCLMKRSRATNLRRHTQSEQRTLATGFNQREEKPWAKTIQFAREWTFYRRKSQFHNMISKLFMPLRKVYINK